MCVRPGPSLHRAVTEGEETLPFLRGDFSPGGQEGESHAQKTDTLTLSPDGCNSSKHS